MLQYMEAIVSLLSLLLVTGAGGRSANLAAAVAVTPSRTMAPNAYWQAVLPSTQMPLAIHDMLTQSADHTPRYDRSTVEEEKSHIEKCHWQRPDSVKIPRKIGQNSNLWKKVEKYGPQGEDDSRKIKTIYDTYIQEDPRKTTVENEYQGKQDSRKITTSYGAEFGGDFSKITTSYDPQDDEDGSRKITVSYRSQDDEDPKKITMSYMSQNDEDSKKITLSYEPQVMEDPKKITMSYGFEDKADPKKTTVSARSQVVDDPKKTTMLYGSQVTEDPKKTTMSYRFEDEEDSKKTTVSYGSQNVDGPEKITMSYGSQVMEDPKKTIMSSSFEDKMDPKKTTVSYGFQVEDNPKKTTMSYGFQGDEPSKGDRHAHIHSDNNRSKMLADVFFFHDALRPGSVITPTIPPTTLLPTLLPRHIADSLPFSTERFADIMAMFKPADPAMAGEIRWALETCKNPRPLPGEKAGCANSLESLVDLPMALLGTRNVRAFSADMPTDPAGSLARRGAYKVTAVRKVSESPEIATCHDLTYPYAVFFCHTTSPAVAYAVTLEATVEGVAPSAMEVLAVCHLDTSLWSPKNAFFVAHNLKPGDAAACHFLSKLSIVWVPADAKQGGASEVQ